MNLENLNFFFFQVDKREVVAIKCIEKSTLTKKLADNLITEISILKQIRHENIVEFKDFQVICQIYVLLYFINV